VFSTSAIVERILGAYLDERKASDDQHAAGETSRRRISKPPSNQAKRKVD
jgi:hypothetical protein